MERSYHNGPPFPTGLRFSSFLGQVVLTPNARARLSEGDLAAALSRHLHRAQGEADLSRRNHHCRIPLDCCRLLSVHRAGNGAAFWIISEPNHARVTVLLPEDFH